MSKLISFLPAFTDALRGVRPCWRYFFGMSGADFSTFDGGVLPGSVSFSSISGLISTLSYSPTTAPLGTTYVPSGLISASAPPPSLVLRNVTVPSFTGCPLNVTLPWTSPFTGPDEQPSINRQFANNNATQ